MKLYTDLQITTIEIGKLSVHPIILKIYQPRCIKALTWSIASENLIDPLLVDKQLRVISGSRRLAACLALGWTHVPVRIIDNLNENAISQLIIGSNQQRRKTLQEIMNEAEEILGILGKHQGQRRDLYDPEKDPEGWGKIGKDRFEIAATIIGNDMSAATLRRLMFVKDFEEKHPEAKSKLGLGAKVINNELSVSKAEQLAKTYVERVKEKDNIKPVEFKSVDKTTLGNYTVHNKSAVSMAELANETVNMVMTSVPYFDVRKYGLKKGAKELGLEASYQEYIENMVQILREVYRVMSPTASFFLNIGDTYSKNKNNLISARLLLAACDQAGFHLVNEIVWQKTNVLPQTTNRRLQPSYEKIYHLVKDANNYYYKPFLYLDDSKDIHLYKMNRRNNRGGHDIGEYALSKPYAKMRDFIKQQEFEDIITSGSASADNAELHKLEPEVDHPAIYPFSICILPILTTTEPGQLILDPFCGSGSTGEAALLLGRRFIGYDIEGRFVSLSDKRLTAVQKSKVKTEDAAHIEKLVKSDNNIDVTHFKDDSKKAA